jgi:hypothetical protein
MKCRKRRYESELEAEASLNVIGPTLIDFTMTAYRCRHCGFWHVGHKRPEMRLESDLRIKIQDIQHRLRFMRKTDKIKKARAELAELHRQLEATKNSPHPKAGA